MSYTRRKAADQFPAPLLDDGVATASSTRGSITATASATPFTAGTWNQIDASLSANANAVEFSLTASTAASATNTSTLLDIGVGAAAAETVWATFAIGYRYMSIAPYRVVIPGFIAAGTRVSVRCRSAVISKAVTGVYAFHATRETALGAPVTYQADVATARGLALTAPGSTNTKSAYTELVASTASAIVALYVGAQENGDTDTGSSGMLLDIAVGAAASEVVVIPDIYYLSSSAEGITPMVGETFGVEIPAGSRISARWARASATDSMDVLLVAATA